MEKLKYILVPVLIIALLSIFGFSNEFVMAEKGGQPAYHISWSPPEISRSISPGYAWEGDISFVSDINLTEAEFFITPELKQFVSLSPESFPSVVANIPKLVHININIPSAALVDTAYEGSIHLRLENKTYPQTLKVNLHIYF